MSAFAKIKKALTLMCIIYTVIISVMFFIGWAVSDTASLFVPTPSKALLMLLFSAILGFASLCLSREGTKPSLLLLHFVICTAAYIITFVVGGNFSLAGDTSIVAIIAFIVVYAVVMLIRALFCRICRRKNTDTKDTEYQSLFK